MPQSSRASIEGKESSNGADEEDDEEEEEEDGLRECNARRSATNDEYSFDCKTMPSCVMYAEDRPPPPPLLFSIRDKPA